MNQPIYKMIDEEFEGFVKGNRKMLEKVRCGTFIVLADVPKNKLCNIGLLEYPFYIIAVSKTDGGDGPLYHFFNRDMNKVYTLYDVM